jgi:hypothetical protein
MTLAVREHRANNVSFRVLHVPWMTAMWYVTLFLSLWLAGCSNALRIDNAKDETNALLTEKITLGKTTKGEIIRSLGNPTSIGGADSGNEQWTYSFVEGSPRANFVPVAGPLAGVQMNNKKIVVLFDKSAIVADFTVSEVAGTELRH